MPNLVTDAFITENTIKGRRILHYLGNANDIRFHIRRDAYYLIMLGLPWGKATVSINNLNQAIEIGGGLHLLSTVQSINLDNQGFTDAQVINNSTREVRFQLNENNEKWVGLNVYEIIII